MLKMISREREGNGIDLTAISAAAFAGGCGTKDLISNYARPPWNSILLARRTKIGKSCTLLLVRHNRYGTIRLWWQEKARLLRSHKSWCARVGT